MGFLEVPFEIQFRKPLEILVEDAMKLKFSQKLCHEFFSAIELLVFQVIQAQCVRLGELLLG